MARIPDAELERLKAEVSVERLVEAAGNRADEDGQGPDGEMPVPRGPGGFADRDPRQESLALLRVRDRGGPLIGL